MMFEYDGVMVEVESESVRHARNVANVESLIDRLLDISNNVELERNKVDLSKE